MQRFTFCLALLLAACGGKSQPPAATPPPSQQQPMPPAAGGPCMKTGCGGTVCTAEEVVTTCEFKPEHVCYKDAICERQQDGACGFTQTPELTACLANPPPVQQ